MVVKVPSLTTRRRSTIHAPGARKEETYISEHTPSKSRVHDMIVTLSAAAASILRKRTQTT